MSWDSIPMVNPSVVILNGNQVVASWYSGEDYEVRVMVGEIPEAPILPKQIWPDPPPEEESTPPTITPSPMPSLTPSIILATQENVQQPQNSSPGTINIFGAAAAVIIIALIAGATLILRKK